LILSLPATFFFFFDMITLIRFVFVGFLKSLESRFSQAQKALVRVFTRSVEIDVGKGLFPGALVKAKLVVPSQFANDLIGNKEANVDVHISVGGQTLDCISENEMVIEVKAFFFYL